MLRLSVVVLPLAIVALACGEESGGDNPSQLRVVSGSGQSGNVNQSLAAPLVVEVRGFDTLPLAGVRIDFRVAAGSGTLNPATSITGEDGRAATVLTPTAAGLVRVVASVFSSSMAVPFHASASGAATSSCGATSARQLAVAQIDAGLGGDGVCLGAAGSNAAYALIAFNADTAVGRSTPIRLDVSGNTLPFVDSTEATYDGVTFPLAIPRQPDIAASTSPASQLVEGEIHQFNVNLAEACTNPINRPARIVAVTSGAIVAADTTNPPGGWTDLEMRDIAVRFDTLYNPTDTLNFRAPADIDDNERVVLFFTRAVNELPATPVSHSTVTFFKRDLQPRARSALGLPACATSNEAELLYLAVPGVGGRTKLSLQADIPRAIAHTYQHLINVSRRLYINFATEFEEPWLDEALSQIAEELLFYRGASTASRLNLGAFDVTLTNENVAAFQSYQRPNLNDYAAFLQFPASFTPLSPADSRAARGAGWSLLRYLADRRGGFDYVTWTRLVNSRESGVRNMLSVFGHELPEWMRDWAISILVDDLFSAPIRFRQLSWNLRSVYSAMGLSGFPLSLTPLQPGTSNLTLAAGGAAYFTVGVPASGAVEVRWPSAAGGAPPPLVQWSVVRLQ